MMLRSRGRQVGAAVTVRTTLALISGLQTFLDHAALDPAGTTHVTSFTTGNIIRGGDGSDIMMGRGGDDIIDGDAWLNVRISVHQNLDGTGPQIATFNTMQEMVPLMLNGTYRVGQLKAVREILYANGPDFDTAKFAGPLSNYTILPWANGVWTVTDNVGTDGTDTVMHVERLQFSDQSMVLVPGLDHEPAGAFTVSDTTPTANQTLTVSIAGVTDADNVSTANPAGHITGPVAIFGRRRLRRGCGA
jgi:hypothetical protein